MRMQLGLNLHTNNIKLTSEALRAVHMDTSGPPSIHQGSPAPMGSHDDEVDPIITSRAMLANYHQDHLSRCAVRQTVTDVLLNHIC